MARRRKRRKNGFWVKLLPKISLVLLVAVTVLVLIFMERSLAGTLLSFAEVQAKWLLTDAIHQAILEEVATEFRYSDLVTSEQDAHDGVVMIHTNMLKVNQMTSNAVIAIDDQLEKLTEREIFVPLGQVTGITFLADLGPKIRMQVLPVGHVAVRLEDRFEEAGVNQTRHLILLKVAGQVQVLVPFSQKQIPIEAEVPIADSVIVGPVPQVYLGNQGLFGGGIRE